MRNTFGNALCVTIYGESIPISAFGHRSVADNRHELIRRKSELHG